MAGYSRRTSFSVKRMGRMKAGQLPARGAIEAKGTKPDVRVIAESKQVKEYLQTYGIVIVTNLREFSDRRAR